MSDQQITITSQPEANAAVVGQTIATTRLDHITRWQPGQSGNPHGKKPGTRNAAALAVERALEIEAEQLGRKVIELAMAGNVAALRMCMERLTPKLRTRAKPTEVDIPVVAQPSDLPAAFSAVVQATARGEITSEEAKDLADVLEMKRKSFETIELEQRMVILEKIASRDRRAL
jgi:hypothetical protein